MPKCILTEQGGKGGGGSLFLQKIEITTPPSRTSYLAGDTFNTSGMVVTASYGINEEITLAKAEVSGYSVSPTTLSDGTTSVTITYSEMGKTVTATQAVTVIHRLTGISITTQPTTRTYEYGDSFSTSGMVITASYSDGVTAAITGYSCSPSTLNTVGTQTITVSYAENGVTQTATTTVTVNRKSVEKPTWISNLTYTGASQSVNSTARWNNFNTTYMSIGGTTSATNAGTYTATFTLGSNYRWTDGTTTAANVNWTINRATGSLSLSTSTVNLSGSNLSQAVTITRAGDGVISYSPTSVTGLTLSLSGNVLTITGNGSTAIAGTTITVSVAQGTNYTAPSSRTITVTATYWTWGTETAVGDSTWWAGLKTWAASATASERAACVGKTKKVSLSTAVLGANAALMRCIGADQDGVGTLTFQAAGTLPTTTVFGSNAVWIGSTARTQCQNFYTYCSARTSIKTVSKGTCPNTNNSRNDTPTYNNETVWLPSEREMGLDNYSPLSVANSTTAKAECTSGYNAAYSYYTSATSRIKYAMSADGTVGTNAQYYWERSRYYNSSYSDSVCFVTGNGTATYYYYDYSGGLAPAFVIG